MKDSAELPEISVIIVNYNCGDLLFECLKSLEKQTFRDFEAIIVDNQSTDGSVQKLKTLIEKRQIGLNLRLIEAERNIGFASGNNLALSYSKSPFIALLNPDCRASENFLDNLLTAIKKSKKIGIAVPKIINANNNKIDSAGDGFSYTLKGFKRGSGCSPEHFDNEGYVFGGCGAAMLIRRDMIDDIGFFDDNFFLIHEDTDLNVRAQLSGWNVYYCPDAIVYHMPRSFILDMSDVAIYYSIRNRDFVRIKSVPLSILFLCMVELLLDIISEFIYFTIKHRRLRLYLKAKLDVVKALPTLIDLRKKVMARKRIKIRHLIEKMTPIWDRLVWMNQLEKIFRG